MKKSSFIQSAKADSPADSPEAARRSIRRKVNNAMEPFDEIRAEKQLSNEIPLDVSDEEEDDREQPVLTVENVPSGVIEPIEEESEHQSDDVSPYFSRKRKANRRNYILDHDL